ncbi:MAG: protein kinase domain-containing protein [Myxococcota bacterium]
MARELQGIADWRLLDVLGEGEHATVYRAVEGDGGDGAAERALKVLHPAVLHDTAEASAFRARIEVARRLGHPRIVDLHDAGEADGRPYAVFERVEGISLDDLPVRRSRGRFEPPAAGIVLRGVLEALAAAGRADPPVAHGRLDAGDVLLDPEGAVRVTGFGVEAEPQADLLPLARLAQDLCRRWPPEVDAWIDRLQHGDDPFPGVAAALEAFPFEALGEDGEQKGRKALRRAVRRIVRKREAEQDDAGEAPKEAPASSRRRRAGRAPDSGPPDAPARAKGGDEADDAAAAVRQAKRVALACLGILLVALTVEIIRFGG